MTASAAVSKVGLSPSAEASRILDSAQIQFRLFRADGEDERQMRDLVFDNGFLGEPFDLICPCKDWFSDVVLNPYIEYEPENIHVAVHKPSGRLVGYLTGAMGGQQFEQRQYNLVKQKVIALAVSLTMPWSLFDQTTRMFASHVIFRGESERPAHPDTGVHWHFQIGRDFRAQGIGSLLLARFANDAINAGFDRIWGEVMAYPEKPVRYFEDRGWSIYDAKPTEIFGDRVDFPVQILTIERSLSSLAL